MYKESFQSFSLDLLISNKENYLITKAQHIFEQLTEATDISLEYCSSPRCGSPACLETGTPRNILSKLPEKLRAQASPNPASTCLLTHVQICQKEKLLSCWLEEIWHVGQVSWFQLGVTLKAKGWDNYTGSQSSSSPTAARRESGTQKEKYHRNICLYYQNQLVGKQNFRRP